MYSGLSYVKVFIFVTDWNLRSTADDYAEFH